MVQAGVRHQPRRAEHQRLQIAHLAEGIVFIDPHLVRQLLGIQAPAFRIGREAHHLHQQRRVRLLHLQGDLMVMARRRLVIGQRRQHPFGPLSRVAQVDVVGARPRSIQRRGLIIAARRARLDGLGHAPDFARRLGQAAEIVRQARLHGGHLDVQFLQQLFLGLVRVRIDEARVGADGGDAFPHASLRHPLRLQQGVGAGGNLGHLLQPHLVHLVRAER